MSPRTRNGPTLLPDVAHVRSKVAVLDHKLAMAKAVGLAQHLSHASRWRRIRWAVVSAISANSVALTLIVLFDTILLPGFAFSTLHATNKARRTSDRPDVPTALAALALDFGARSLETWPARRPGLSPTLGRPPTFAFACSANNGNNSTATNA